MAYLTPEERQLFAWIVKEKYTGIGEIVDAGAFLGGSAACFAQGISQNKIAAERAGRIHSYDFFRYANWIAKNIDALKNHKVGDSFLNISHDSMKGLDEFVNYYPGDITSRKWGSLPIEILMLDCSNTDATNDHCLLQFFPALVPGSSYVLHQDYGVVTRLYWIHTTMYLLRDKFEYCGEVERGGTVAFKCIGKIDRAEVENIIQQKNKMDIMDTAKIVAEYMSFSKKCAYSVVNSAQAFMDNPI